MSSSPRKIKGANKVGQGGSSKGLNLNVPIDRKDTVRESQESAAKLIGRQSPDPPKESMSRLPLHNVG